MKNKNIFRSFIEFSIGPVVAGLIGIISAPLITWFLNPGEYGKIAEFQLYLSFATILVSMGLDQAFIREFHNEKNTRKLLAHSVLIPALFTFVNVLLLFIFPTFFSEVLFGSKQYIYIVYGLGIALISLCINKFSMVIVRMEEKGIMYSLFSIITNATILILNITLLVNWKDSFESLVVSNILANIVVSFVAFFVTRKYWNLFNIKFDKTLFWKLVSFAIPLVPALLIGLLFQSIDRLSLIWYSDSEQVGLFQLCISITMALTLIQTAFANAWVPIAYRWNSEKADYQNFEFIGILLMLFLALAFFGLMVARELIVLVINESYASVLTIFPFLALSTIMSTLSEVTSLGIPFSRKNKYTLLISIIVLLVNFVGNWLLVPTLGALGATISTGISYIFFFWMRTLISRALWYDFKILRYVIFTVIMLAAAICSTVLSRDLAFILNGIAVIILIILCAYLYIKNKDKIKKVIRGSEAIER